VSTNPAVASASSTGTTLQGFSNPGSILSPLMLVTLAALPTAQEEQNDGSSAKHGAIHPHAPTINPMAALGLG
jgi:hypothetical protein